MRSEKALRIGKGARNTRGRAAWQRYLKQKHARLVLGAPRSPGLIFLLCEQQPLELRCFGGLTVAMVTARARAGYGARRWARGRPGRASAERFAASQPRTGLEGFEWTGE